MSPDAYKRAFGDGRASRRNASIGYGGRAYDAGRSDTREMSAWRPALAHPDNEVLSTRDKITARARDLDRNHPIISGAIDRREEMVVGVNIRLEATPDFEAMGRTADWADNWSTGVEAGFRVWGRDSRHLNDVERHSTFGMQTATAYRHWWVDGEACGVIYDLDRGGTHSTSLRLIDPDRLSNPDNLPDNHRLANGNRVVGGVELDANGGAVAYHVRVSHPAATGPDINIFRWERIAREGPTGRPRFIHAYKRNRAEQRRAVSRMVASMKRTKMFDRYDNAELEAALLNAVMAAVVESPYPTADVRDAFAPPGGEGDSEGGWSLEKQVEYRQQNKVRFDGVQLTHGLPGENFKFLKAERPSENYPEFQATGLRSIAAQFGLSYPQLSQNWADINYSSARTLLNEIWRGLLHDRWLFTQLFCTPVYAAWLEEDVARGNTKVPGGRAAFYRHRAALTMCEWMGPGRGKIDPKKEADAADLDTAAGRTNLSILAAEQGLDPRQVMMGQVRDIKRRRAMGLPEPSTAPSQQGARDENPDAADTADRREAAGEDA